MEHRDLVSETKEYKKYRDSVLASRPSLIKAREESAQSKALKQKFGGRPRDKLKKGYTYEEIIERKTYRAVDHLGNRYATEEDMCNTYGVKKSTYRRRSAAGKSKEEALTGKVFYFYFGSELLDNISEPK